MDFDMKEFGERLKKARVATGKSQAALGSAAGLSAQAISAYEKGKQKPAIDAAAILADALGVSLDDLCGIEKKPAAEVHVNEAAEKPGCALTNYADVVEHLAALSKFFRCSCGTKEFDLPEEEWCTDEFVGPITTYTRAALYITDHNLVNFISQWNKMYSLYCEGVIQKDLFETWYKGMLGNLSARCLNEYHHPIRAFDVPLFGFDGDTGDIQDK